MALESPWDDNSDARPPDEASEAPGERLKPTGPRWQFSLRTLFILFTLIAVVAGVVVADFWKELFVFSTLQMFFTVMGVQFYIVFVGQRLSRWSFLFAVWFGILGTFYCLGSMQGVSVPVVSVIEDLLYITPILFFPQWLQAWVLWRVLVRKPDDFSFTRVRRTAIFSTALALALVSFAVGACIFRYEQEVDEDYLHSDWHTRYMLTEAFSPIEPFVFVASSVVAIPWARLVRTKDAAHYRQYSFWETISKGLLLLCISVALLSLVALFWFYVNFYELDWVAWRTVTTLYYMLPQVVSASVFVAAFLLQLYRDRWHKWLTLINSVYFVFFWLLVVANPEVLFWLD